MLKLTTGSVDLTHQKSGMGYFKQKTKESCYIPINSVSGMNAELLHINKQTCDDKRSEHLSSESKVYMEALRRFDTGNYF